MVNENAAAETGKNIEDMPLDERFAFGSNWMSYIDLLDEQRISKAEDTLREMLSLANLDGLTFLDIGCGSGLFSLAARRLGADVTSIDFDPNSIQCAEKLREKWFPSDRTWRIWQGSVLDDELMKNLGHFDIVYSWGVLHHTGQMWKAVDNAINCVRPDGEFFIAIYNDQGRISSYWLKVKKRYNAASSVGKRIMINYHIVRFWWKTILRDTYRYKDPFYSWRNYSSERGMDVYHDMVDWIGGYPFEVAKPEAIFDFCRERGLVLLKLKTCGGGLGCNEFVFKRIANSLQCLEGH
jgi:2-polyprenyl-6-hydroxyphenyl methylase/3-demethylubiquinone-9 3-methyltransferase